MAIFEWLRFLLGLVFLIGGLIIFIIELIGVFRFSYVLNRMHAAALGDTLGISLSMLGLMIISGFNYTSLKLLLVVVFLWFASPTASHVIARFEATTNEEIDKECEIK